MEPEIDALPYPYPAPTTGLTCIQMIHQFIQCNETYNQKWMREFVGTESIWTIDLVFLLHRILTCSRRNNVDATEAEALDQSLNTETIGTNSRNDAQHKSHVCQIGQPHASVKYVFCSTKFGVDESYIKFGYYEEAYANDFKRVERLFSIALQESMPILQIPYLSLELLVSIVSRKGCVAIVLVDNAILLGRGASCNSEDGDLRTTEASNTYSGHYVVLCGISYDSNDISYTQSNDGLDYSCCGEEFCMVLNNPGSWKEQEFVTPKRFEAAWRANGTDEDIILINMDLHL